MRYKAKLTGDARACAAERADLGLPRPCCVHTVPMKRTILAILAALLLLALPPSDPVRPDPAAGVLRLHILANSDSPEDQTVKLRVRDALLPLFEAASSYDDARAFVLDHGAALLDRCQAILSAAGVPYGAQLLLGLSDFPDRTYGGTLFPAGAYDALQIVLGDGAGHNWWCVLFPPLCIVTRNGSTPTASPEALNGAAPSSVPVTFESDILAFLRKRFGKRSQGTGLPGPEPELCGRGPAPAGGERRA